MRKEQGFTLVEFLIVVAVILVIAAIAIPSLLRGRIAANEASAVSSMRALSTAQMAYSTSYPEVGYSSSLSNLGSTPGCSPVDTATSSHACLIDEVLQSGKKSGYSFALANATGSPINAYTLNADPITQGVSGRRHFFSDATGVIRVNESQTATSADSPLN